jgi:oxepin-CoA hydrolase/3-oxo-5,6-dehydrosuberyl-CoA semialdehyde dehydrogenase
VLVLDRDSAAESTGHGTPMPQLVHGGPGRAGGGEELGGMRSVKHFMQRTALQGSPAVIEALVGGS